MVDRDYLEALICSVQEWNRARSLEASFPNLREANLCRADLRGANLCRADLRGANLCRADLPSPAVFLLASWGSLSDHLTLGLMRLDAESHPDPEKFDDWAAGGGCPYDGCRWERVANFTERRELWSPGRAPRIADLVEMLIAEKCAGEAGA